MTYRIISLGEMNGLGDRICELLQQQLEQGETFQRMLCECTGLKEQQHQEECSSMTWIVSVCLRWLFGRLTFNIRRRGRWFWEIERNSSTLLCQYRLKGQCPFSRAERFRFFQGRSLFPCELFWQRKIQCRICFVSVQDLSKFGHWESCSSITLIVY